MTERHDVIIIGGGTMGTAAAWALGKRGISSLVLERFQHVHAFGSHGGETRIIRHAYAESPDYVPFVRRADALWQELEAESGQQLLVRCGGLELAAPGYGHARAARASAEEHNLPFEWLTGDEATKRWPMFRVPSDWDALYSPASGFLLTAPALTAMASGARTAGATIREHATVTGWGSDGSRVWVDVEGERHHGQAAILAPGAWAGGILANLGLPLQVRRKTLWWQAVDDPDAFAPDRCPVFITDSPAGEIYGFPIYGTPGVKIANHQGGESADPDHVDRQTRDGENADCLQLANLLLPGVSAKVVQSAVCLYTMTPDTDFIIDRHPFYANVAIAAGFSGHGFKFAPAVGELLADLVTNPAAETLPRTRIARFL